MQKAGDCRSNPLLRNSPTRGATGFRRDRLRWGLVQAGVIANHRESVRLFFSCWRIAQAQNFRK